MSVRIPDGTPQEPAVAWCHDYLIEPDWQEGFTCSLARNHPGPHRAGGWPGVQEDNVGKDASGRRYRWVYEWRYEDESTGNR